MTEPQAPSKPAETKKKGPLPALFLTIFLDLFGFGMLLPLLPFYAAEFQADAFLIGLIFSSYSFAQFLFAPFWGQISDRFGRRPVLIGTVAGTTIAHGALALAPSLTLVFIARIAAGIFAANYSIAQAYIADITDREGRARGMGILGAAFGLGFVFGPAVGAIVGASFDLRAVPMLAAVLSAINWFLLIVRLPESLPPERRSKKPWRWLLSGFEAFGHKGSLTALLSLFFFIVLAFSAMEAMLALFLEERFGWDIANTGMLLVYIGVVMVIVQGAFLGRLVKRFGEPNLILAGILSTLAGLALFPFSHGLPLLLTASALLAIGSGLYSPSLTGLVSRLVPEDSQGSTLGVTRSPGALARAVGPAVGGALFSSLGEMAPFFAAAGIMLLCFALATWVLGRLGPATAD
ncbi:MAG: MFS transporter [Acidobacteriota bacterium]